jgi:hypothetical protein
MTESGLRRCILFPIDMHGVSRATLETLVKIARQLDRKLLGLLMEDTRLQQVADLPFTTEISLAGGHERNLLREQLLQRHNLISADTRAQLSKLATNNRVEISFRPATGARWTTVLARDSNEDIFLPARIRWNTQFPALIRQASIIKRLGVVLANDSTDTRMLATAESLSKANLVREIYLLSKKAPHPDQLHDLRCRNQQVRSYPNFSCSPATLLALIKQSPYDLLLIPGQCLQDIPGAELDIALEKSSGQVLVIN